MMDATMIFAMCRGVRFFLMLTLVCCALSASVARAGSSSAEYAVKAAFLFNFAKFVDWPAATFPDANKPIIIGVLGDDPFGQQLEETVQGELILGRKVVIQRSSQVDDLKACQLLFICKSEKNKISEIIAALGNANILTVGETEGFARHGGIIGFYLDNNKVRFEINPDAAKSHGLKISSKLLGLARIVNSEPAQGGNK